MTVTGTRSVSRSWVQVETTRCASCQHAVSVSSRAPGSTGQPQAVLGDQPAGVGVVGQHGRLARVDGGEPLAARVDPGEQPGAGEAAQPGAHPVGELAGGLAGERQAQHPVRRDQPVGHEPDHAGGHRLGLARPGTGDDQRGLGGRGDHGHLLVGRRGQPQLGGQQAGADQVAGHSVTWRPLGLTGQLKRTGQRAQSGFCRAT